MPTTVAPSAAFVPAASIGEVIERLDAIIDRARRTNDRGGYFACLYRSVTARVRDGIAAGRFQDPARMERLDVVFANRYLQAVQDHQAGRVCTRSWQAAFKAASAGDLLVLQQLLLGMNAHINLDLGVAAGCVAPGAKIQGLKHDFMEITVLLEEMMDHVQDRVATVSPWMTIVDRLGGHADERVFGWGLGMARELAWRTAERFAAIPAERHGDEIARLDPVVAALALPIRRPGLLLTRMALRIVRMREPSEVGKVAGRAERLNPPAGGGWREGPDACGASGPSFVRSGAGDPFRCRLVILSGRVDDDVNRLRSGICAM